MITLRDEPTYASAGFRAGPLFWPNWNLEFGNVVFFFLQGRKPENTTKKLSEQGKNQQETQLADH